MSWLANFVRPKINALMRRQEVPEHFWTKCPECAHMLFHKELRDNLDVCHHCCYHFRLGIMERMDLFFDGKEYTLQEIPEVLQDPLKFKDSKRYVDRLKEYRQKTSRTDAVIVAYGSIGGTSSVVIGFDFSFMGGSMSLHAGAAFTKAAELAVQTNSALVVVTASGGARMQEGILSLMQMAKTTVAVMRVKEASLPYIVILTDPTTGGITASFGMLGDITLAEPGALICFAGARVIEETIRQKLPDGFQKAEFLLEHGMVDKVVHRKELKKVLSQLLGYCMRSTHSLKKSYTPKRNSPS